MPRINQPEATFPSVYVHLFGSYFPGEVANPIGRLFEVFNSGHSGQVIPGKLFRPSHSEECTARRRRGISLKYHSALDSHQKKVERISLAYYGPRDPSLPSG